MKHPNLVWEVRSRDGRLMSCLLASGVLAHAVVRYVDEIVSSVEEFDDLAAAREHVRRLYTDTLPSQVARRGADAQPGRPSRGRPSAETDR